MMFPNGGFSLFLIHSSLGVAYCFVSYSFAVNSGELMTLGDLAPHLQLARETKCLVDAVLTVNYQEYKRGTFCRLGDEHHLIQKTVQIPETAQSLAVTKLLEFSHFEEETGLRVLKETQQQKLVDLVQVSGRCFCVRTGPFFVVNLEDL